MERTSFSTSCPHCGAHRAPAPECPRCGVYYAKAEARAARAALEVEAPPALLPPEPEPGRPPHLPEEALRWDGAVEDTRLELRVRTFAVPVALLVTWLLHSTGLGHTLLRIFMSMWIHELGHAVTAWFCGFFALPGPWATSTGDTRSPLLSLLLAGGLGWLTWRGWKLRRRPWLIAGSVLLGVQFVGTLLLGQREARSLITFGGDGGCLVLGTLLMTTLYTGPDSALRQRGLRWGFLVIGAAAFTDAFRTWWSSRTDFGAIPFGLIEGVGLSDPSKLTDSYGWSVHALISRYVTLGSLCLVALGMVYGIGVFRARAAVRA